MISIEKANEYYEALLHRNTQYVGIFYAAVKTTSVFCISTCRARKPKRENVEFYSTFKEAIQNGYRPCKVCQPTQNANEAPLPVKQAIELVKSNPKEKIADTYLRNKGISPELVRRWFKKNYNLTFHAFQRMYRINNAYKELKEGKKTTHAAFDQGYESLSGFGYTYKKIIGKSPNNSKNKGVILINRLTTPIGPMFIAATESGVCLLEFTDRKMLETELSDLQKRLKANILVGENLMIKNAKKQIADYFKGERKSFDIPLHAPGTAFQIKVWEILKEVAYGTTSTYQKQAQKIENPKAIRAVARANGANRIAILIPCHRIIGKDGHLTGYGGGIERKKWLLQFEKSNC